MAFKPPRESTERELAADMARTQKSIDRHEQEGNGQATRLMQLTNKVRRTELLQRRLSERYAGHE
jgi:hypothetical protein